MLTLRIPDTKEMEKLAKKFPNTIFKWTISFNKDMDDQQKYLFNRLKGIANEAKD